MIRAIAIDDEQYMLDEIKKKLVDFFPKEVVLISETRSVIDGIQAVEKFEPDLLLLDVHLLDGTGFDLIQNCSFKNFDVIFITGYDTNAIRAIKVGALDYILKPIDDTEFKEAVQKAIDHQDRERYLDTLVTVSNDHYKGLEKNRIVLKTSDSIYAMDQDDILYCHSEGNYTTVYTQKSNKILVSGHIKKLEELLPPHIFIRCHQSYIINKNHVLKYSKRGHLLLKNETKIPVSSRRKEMTLHGIFK